MRLIIVCICSVCVHHEEMSALTKLNDLDTLKIVNMYIHQ